MQRGERKNIMGAYFGKKMLYQNHHEQDLRDSDLILEPPWLPRHQHKGPSYIKLLLHSKQKNGQILL